MLRRHSAGSVDTNLTPVNVSYRFRYYGTKCSGCLQSIPANELVMRAVGNVYHLQCFICAICGHQLQKGDQYVVKDNQLFCRLDFEKEYALMQISPKSDWCTSFSPKSKSLIFNSYFTLPYFYLLVNLIFSTKPKSCTWRTYSHTLSLCISSIHTP